jgi:UDP-N-acetylglucosamine 1-carboxyvinyltransferase
MGADISVSGDTAVVNGVPELFGERVKAYDLRGGAAMVLAGLVAKGTTVVEDAMHIDRGYDSLEKTLTNLGAKIERKVL